jgi:hypothetical protein
MPTTASNTATIANALSKKEEEEAVINRKEMAEGTGLEPA